MDFNIKEVEKYLTQDIMQKYPSLDKRQAKKLLIEALCRKPVIEEINKVIKFLVDSSINKR